MQPMTAKIAGRRHHPAEFNLLSTFVLVHEKTNQLDPFAVAVYADEQQIGYLERGLAQIVAPLLDRHRPVFASAIENKDNLIKLFVPSRYDRLGQNIIIMPSSDGQRSYATDRRHRICTCPAGIFVLCKHKKALGLTAIPKSKPSISVNPVTAVPVTLSQN
jgi:hypothetical protein